jgi:hypothetical protein
VQQLPGYVRAYPGKCAPLSPPGKRNLSLCTVIRASRYQSERPYHRYEWDDTAAVTMMFALRPTIVGGDWRPHRRAPRLRC